MNNIEVKYILTAIYSETSNIREPGGIITKPMLDWCVKL